MDNLDIAEGARPGASRICPAFACAKGDCHASAGPGKGQDVHINAGAAAGDRVHAAIGRNVDRVTVSPTVDGVVACASGQNVIARAAGQHIIQRRADNGIVARAAINGVRGGPTTAQVDGIVKGRACNDLDLGKGAAGCTGCIDAGFADPAKNADPARGTAKVQRVAVCAGRSAVDGVIAFGGADGKAVRIGPAKQGVIASAAVQKVIARVAKQRVIAGAAKQAVVASAAIDGVVARTAEHLVISAIRLDQIIIGTVARDDRVIGVDPVALRIAQIGPVDNIVASGARHGAIRPGNADRHQRAEIGQGAGGHAHQRQGLAVRECQQRIAKAIVGHDHIQHIDRIARPIHQPRHIDLIAPGECAVEIGHGGGKVADPVGPAAIGQNHGIHDRIGPQIDLVIARAAGHPVGPGARVDDIRTRPAGDGVIARAGRNVDAAGRGAGIDGIGKSGGLDLLNLGKAASAAARKGKTASLGPGHGDGDALGRARQVQHIGIGVACVLATLNRGYTSGVGNRDLIAASAATDAVIAGRAGQRIHACAADQGVIADPAIQTVIFGAAIQQVIACATRQSIAVCAAIQAVVGIGPGNRVIARVTRQGVAVGGGRVVGAGDDIIACAAKDRVIGRTHGDRVIAQPAINRVGIRNPLARADKYIVSFAQIDDVRAAAGGVACILIRDPVIAGACGNAVIALTTRQ